VAEGQLLLQGEVGVIGVEGNTFDLMKNGFLDEGRDPHGAFVRSQLDDMVQSQYPFQLLFRFSGDIRTDLVDARIKRNHEASLSKIYG